MTFPTARFAFPWALTFAACGGSSAVADGGARVDSAVTTDAAADAGPSSPLSRYTLLRAWGPCMPGARCTETFTAEAGVIDYAGPRGDLGADPTAAELRMLVDAATAPALLAALDSKNACPMVADLSVQMTVKVANGTVHMKEIAGCTDAVGNPIQAPYQDILRITQILSMRYFP